MKVQYSKLVEHIDRVSIFMCLISVLIGLINLFTKFLSPLFYNLIVSTFALSVIGFAISDLHSIISQKNRKPGTIGYTSILKKVFVVIIFLLKCLVTYNFSIMLTQILMSPSVLTDSSAILTFDHAGVAPAKSSFDSFLASIIHGY